MEQLLLPGDQLYVITDTSKPKLIAQKKTQSKNKKPSRIEPKANSFFFFYLLIFINGLSANRIKLTFYFLQKTCNCDKSKILQSVPIESDESCTSVGDTPYISNTLLNPKMKNVNIFCL